MITIKSEKEIELMREACRIANLAQKAIEAEIKPGMTTLDLDRIAEKAMRDNGAMLKKDIQVELRELWTFLVLFVLL